MCLICTANYLKNQIFLQKIIRWGQYMYLLFQNFKGVCANFCVYVFRLHKNFSAQKMKISLCSKSTQNRYYLQICGFLSKDVHLRNGPPDINVKRLTQRLVHKDHIHISSQMCIRKTWLQCHNKVKSCVNSPITLQRQINVILQVLICITAPVSMQYQCQIRDIYSRNLFQHDIKITRQTFIQFKLKECNINVKAQTYAQLTLHSVK